MMRNAGLKRCLPPFARLAAAWLLGLIALGAAGPAEAGLITIGTNTGGNVFPFGSESYVGGYQQVYAAGAFSGPITISGLSFATTLGNNGNARPTSDTLILSLGLSTTSRTPTTLSSNFGQNRGADFTQVFSGTQTFLPAYDGTFDLVFAINPFVYNPANGSLLLDVNITSVDLTGPGTFIGFQAGTDPRVGRVFNLDGNGSPFTAQNSGLVTQFTTIDAVPEPASLGLLGLGSVIAGLAARARRRG